jgi:hypothetical protein
MLGFSVAALFNREFILAGAELALTVLLAVGYLLPFLTGQMQTIGKLISPLHIPVFICGLTCGWVWGGALGLILPVLRMALFGMPGAPMAYPMAFELCAYGVVAGVVYPWLCRELGAKHGANRLVVMLASLGLAMVAGRIVGGAAKALLLMAGAIPGAPLTFAAFVTAYFVDTAVIFVLYQFLFDLSNLISGIESDA